MTKTDRRFIEIQGSENINGGYSKIDDLVECGNEKHFTCCTHFWYISVVCSEKEQGEIASFQRGSSHGNANFKW